MSTSPVAFLSYAHRDDSYHDGAVTKLRAALSGAIGVAIGEDFPIFQDRKDIAWGEHWPSKLEQGLAGGRFLIAILSPSFFNSDYCRKELSEFLEIESATGRQDLILPIYFVTTPFLENSIKRDADPLAKAISQRQYRDWRELRHEPFTAPKVRRALASLADGLVQALERSEIAGSERVADTGIFVTRHMEDVGNYETGAFDDPMEFAHQARDRGLMEQNAPFVASSASNLPEPGTIFRDIDKPWCPEMVVIPAGLFTMGSPPDEEGHLENAEPEHRVTFNKPFALGRYPVTFDEFDHFCFETGRGRPGEKGWGRGRRPVIHVTVKDAEAYLAWLSDVTGRSYCLPSEAMWEYACRSGITTPFWTGGTITTDQANYNGSFPYGDGKKGQYRKQTVDVGSFPANPFGLFDMHGNVWEWCADHWHDSYHGAPGDGTVWLDGGHPALRVLRGGSWSSLAHLLRSACRIAGGLDSRDDGVGFRCARVQD